MKEILSWLKSIFFYFRGKENNFSMKLNSKVWIQSSKIVQKIQASCAPPPCGITLPSKQDVFVGFATVPGFVSFTSEDGSPYLQVGGNTCTCTFLESIFWQHKALAQELSERHATADLSDIHLLVKVGRGCCTNQKLFTRGSLQ